MKWSEMILLAGLAAFAGILLKDSLALPYSSPQGFGAGFIPLNFAAATLALTGFLALRALLAHRTSEPGQQEPGERPWKIALPAIATMALLFAATYAMSFGSVLVPLAVAITVVSTVFLNHSWRRSALLAVVTLAVIYAIFSLWLKIPLT